MTGAISTAFAAMLVASVLAYQAPQNPADATGLIVGRLVDASDNSAVTGALVSLVGPAARKVIVDDRGRFAFTALPPGSYSIAASKSRYLPAAFGKMRPDGAGRTLDLGAGQTITDAAVTMWRAAAITGTVTDDTGQPMPVRVQAFRRTIVAGRPRLVSSGAFASTDDRGVYRFAGLTPGDYFVATMTYTISAPVAAAAMVDALKRTGGAPAGDFQLDAMRKGAGTPLLDLYNLGNGMERHADVLVMFGGGPSVPSSQTDGPLSHFSSVWYPAAPTPAQATAVTVAAGDERAGIDLRLRLTPSVMVSGTVTGPDGPVANLGLRLVPAGLDEMANETVVFPSVTASSGDGSFTFAGVNPGQYVIRAATMPRLGATPETPMNAGMLWVATPVTVGETDLTGVRATAHAGAKITGRLVLDGSSTPITPADIRNSVSVEPADGRLIAPAPVYQMLVDRDGTVSSAGLPAGRYFVRVAGTIKGWTLKSATAHGLDVADRPLSIEADDVGDLVLTFTDHPTAISGTVHSSQGAADPDAAILLFPTDSSLWRDTGATPRTIRSARPGRTGSFAISGVPAGDYWAIAIADGVSAGWQDPIKLQAFVRNATRVHVEDGQTASVSLTTVIR